MKKIDLHVYLHYSLASEIQETLGKVECFLNEILNNEKIDDGTKIKILLDSDDFMTAENRLRLLQIFENRSVRNFEKAGFKMEPRQYIKKTFDILNREVLEKAWQAAHNAVDLKPHEDKEKVWKKERLWQLGEIVKLVKKEFLE